MVLLHHEFRIRSADGKRMRKVTSTLQAYVSSIVGHASKVCKYVVPGKLGQTVRAYCAQVRSTVSRRAFCNGNDGRSARWSCRFDGPQRNHPATRCRTPHHKGDLRPHSGEACRDGRRLHRTRISAVNETVHASVLHGSTEPVPTSVYNKLSHAWWLFEPEHCTSPCTLRLEARKDQHVPVHLGITDPPRRAAVRTAQRVPIFQQAQHRLCWPRQTITAGR